MVLLCYLLRLVHKHQSILEFNNSREGFLFFQMKKHHHYKTYTLATEIVQQSPRSTDGDSGPYRFVEENYRPPNIFNTAHLEKLTFIQLSGQKLYEYVGVKELKSYHDRVKRSHKDKKRDTNSNSAIFIIPRSSGSGNQQASQEYLSKDQLFNKILKAECTQTPPYLKMMQCSKGTSMDSRKKILVLQKQDGNILKIKKKMDQYTKIWEAIDKDAVRSRSNGKNNMKNCRHNNKMKQSILRVRNSGSSAISSSTPNQNSHNYHKKQLVWNRTEASMISTLNDCHAKQANKEITSLQHQQENIPPSRWQEILRKNQGLTDVYEKKRLKIEKIQSTIKVKGLSKIKEEVDWLKSKEKEGFYFKSYDSKTNGKGKKSEIKHHESHEGAFNQTGFLKHTDTGFLKHTDSGLLKHSETGTLRYTDAGSSKQKTALIL